MPDSAASDRRDHVDRRLNDTYAHARVERGRLVAADREDRAAPLKARHQQVEQQRQADHRERRRPVERHAEQAPAGRQIAGQIEVAPLGDDERRAARDAHHAERRDERRQPHEHDQRGARQPARRAGEESGRCAGTRVQCRSTNKAPATTPVNAITAPGDRSMPPEMITIAAPTAAMP